ncbi:MAG: LysM peptidoglycan-binding domain-containing protein, partial [Lentisphaerae bacterium]|nr:LysM peptidoglycan-binding domain-containing protein [Lentisphaerota bacterium]
IDLLERVLHGDPDNARAHLDLAILLHDQRRDFVGAIYHYRRYVELRPGTEKAEMIQHRIRVAEQLFGAKLLAGREEEAAEQAAAYRRRKEAEAAEEAGIDPEELARRQDEAAALSEQAERYKRVIDRTTAEFEKREEELAVENAALKNKVEKLELLVARVRAERDAAREAAAESGQRPAGGFQSVVRTYRVKRGDTLSRIAAELYGDAQQWRRIYNANEEILGGENRLRVGQVLVIP